MRFDPTITLGSIFATVAFVCAALFAWRDLNWRVRNIETWKSAHEHTAEEAHRNISMLREAIVKIEALAEGQNRRIELIENNFRLEN